MNLYFKEASNRSLLKEFIHFPFRLYRGNPQWLPPLISDEWKFHTPGKNKALAHSDTIRFNAYSEGIMVGRIMGIIHHLYNKQSGQDVARFFAYECIEDQQVAHTLLDAVENWARLKGFHKMTGPFGFSDKDPQGALISGFEHDAVITTPYNPPYYARQLEGEGYARELDLVEYHIPVPAEVPEFYQRICERILRNPAFRCVEFRKKSEMKPYIQPVLGLMNETFMGIYGFYPLSPSEIESLAREYMPVLDPEFVKVIVSDNEPVAFIIGMPDIGPGLRKARGRLYPFGIFHVLHDIRHSDYLVLLVGAIRNDHQGIGLDALLGTKMLESAIGRGMKLINSHLELETNVKVRAEMERAGGKVSKVYRVFGKEI